MSPEDEVKVPNEKKESKEKYKPQKSSTKTSSSKRASPTNLVVENVANQLKNMTVNTVPQEATRAQDPSNDIIIPGNKAYSDIKKI